MFPKWLLPEFVEDVLPFEAKRVEAVRRSLLDQYSTFGYELVSPPLIEYLESLLTGSGRDLDLQTFKTVDQLSGRTLGIRPDITPQIARIDAHLMANAGVTRLCYADRVLRTKPSESEGSREIVQVGAELFGCAHIGADIEIVKMMVSSVKRVMGNSLLLDLGNVSIPRSVADWLGLDEGERSVFFEGLQKKDTTLLGEFVTDFSEEKKVVVMALPKLYGDISILDTARGVLEPVPGALSGIDELSAVSAAVRSNLDSVTIDLSHSRGFEYHSGLVVALYAEDGATVIARGGRYDHIGEAFGNARAATGFTVDVRRVAACALNREVLSKHMKKIIAPYAQDDLVLQAKIERLRIEGNVVVEDLLHNAQILGDSEFTHELYEKNSEWILKEL